MSEAEFLPLFAPLPYLGGAGINTDPSRAEVGARACQRGFKSLVRTDYPVLEVRRSTGPEKIGRIAMRAEVVRTDAFKVLLGSQPATASIRGDECDQEATWARTATGSIHCGGSRELGRYEETSPGRVGTSRAKALPRHPPTPAHR